MPKDSSRPLVSFPASSSDFALPSSSSTPSNILDETNVLLQRFRRPSLLQKGGYFQDSRIHSPLASSAFTLHSRRRSQSTNVTEESESDKERMMTDSPSSSETHTPPLKVPSASEEDIVKPLTPKPPSTPPRRKSSAASMDGLDLPPFFSRRPPFPLKQQRILNILSESKPEDAEVKSEAAFQRLIASCSELPTQPRTPRSFIDRGRYPEEAGHEEPSNNDDLSDDSDAEPDDTYAFSTAAPPTATQPIAIKRPRTRTPGGSLAGSLAGSVNGDDATMSVSETSSSFGGGAMDVDSMPLGSPLLPSFTPTAQWRHTPPPTATAVRTNKRKLDDRYDPYPNSSKRRAVSPSLHHLRDHSHSQSHSPHARGSSISRHPISLPIAIPASATSSAASSPTISSSYSSYPRTLGLTASPTLRSTISLASPILRPLVRRRGDEELERREMEGAGQAVNDLTLNSEGAYSAGSASSSMSEITSLR